MSVRLENLERLILTNNMPSEQLASGARVVFDAIRRKSII